MFRVIRAAAGKVFVKRTRVRVFAATEAGTGTAIVVALGDTIVLTIFLMIIKPMNTNEESTTAHHGSNKLGMKACFSFVD
jgi:hypothetical protein